MNQKKQIWKNRSFLFLITAQLASALGEGIVILALLALFGFEKDATPLEMAMVVLATSVPTVVFGPIAGLFADRLERKTLMMLLDIARAVICFLSCLLLTRGKFIFCLY
ncbi:MFS transporter [Bacillus methanolicus]|uniref:MFS transporter n=1 Tax=Bacillus methanolicus TaxID=1471 RepID=UPI0020106A45|nr:MFS transporter [Bacillus methanolicus]